MADASRIAAVVLAAGSSRRFGSDKLLHPVTLGGVTLPLAAHSLLPWLKTFERVTVVVRPDSEGFCRVVAGSLAAGTPRAAKLGTPHWVECPDAERGMGVSLACGVGANRGASGWVIGLADMPVVPSDAIACVRNALLIGAALSAPCCNGRRGHPVGFAARYRDELLAIEGDAGARHLLERDAGHLVQIIMRSDGVFADIDTPGDLHRL